MTTALVGDIGGTNARFALWQDGQLTDIRVLATADFARPQEAVCAYLEQVRRSVDALQSVCLACAGPVLGDEFRFTNNHWVLSRKGFCEELGLRELLLINDFAAQALAMSRVREDELIEVCGGEAEPLRPRLVIGPGTGLGVGTLLKQGSGWQALPGEGGHVDLPVVSEREMALWQQLRQRFDHVSAEHVLSGSGLLNLYRAACALDGRNATLESAAAISDAALNGDRFAETVLEQFCCFLGRVVGNNVLTLGARGGVYIVGGILPRFAQFFCDSGFTAAMREKGQMSGYLEGIPVWLVKAEHPGLLGAGVALQQVLDNRS